jgi:hypothetical protein
VVYASETPMGDIPMAPLAAGLQEYRGSNDDLAFRSHHTYYTESQNIRHQHPTLGTTTWQKNDQTGQVGCRG